MDSCEGPCQEEVPYLNPAQMLGSAVATWIWREMIIITTCISAKGFSALYVNLLFYIPRYFGALGFICMNMYSFACQVYSVVSIKLDCFVFPFKRLFVSYFIDLCSVELWDGVTARPPQYVFCLFWAHAYLRWTVLSFYLINHHYFHIKTLILTDVFQ